MAANDPSFDVPTPRGVLRGVAAFNWDGSQWQPQGRAATEVATPTGVLRGVAAFTGGAPWAPNTRAQTEVATPSGVLDGVAVYTWSGSQWTPPSGNIETATPSGILEGMAAFDWDGTNWQPQAQAGAEVPTPYGVLTGVARFGWTGSAWAATGAPTLSLDFMNPAAGLDARVSFVRASPGAYTDQTGAIRVAGVNVPRWDYDPVTHQLRGVLVEEQRTNLVFPSVPDATVWSNGAATLTLNAGVAPDGTNTATQVAETAANAMHYMLRGAITTSSVGPQTISLYAKANGTRYLQVSLDDSGSGTIGAFATFDLQAGVVSGALTARGGASIGTATITAVANGYYRCAFTATLTGASLADRLLLILSDTAAPAFSPSYAGNAANSVLIWGVDIEVGASPSSYIATTAASATRSADSPTLTDAALFLGANGKTLLVEAFAVQPTPAGQDVAWVDLRDGTPTNILQFHTPPVSSDIVTVVLIGGTTFVNGANVTIARPGVFKAAVSNGTVWRGAVNGALVPGSGGASATGSGVFNLLQIGTGGTTQCGGHIRAVGFWNRAMGDSELQARTA